jgi:hypothetical protein
LLQVDVGPFFADPAGVVAANPVAVVYSDRTVLVRFSDQMGRVAPIEGVPGLPVVYERYEFTEEGFAQLLEEIRSARTALVSPDAGDAPGTMDLDVTRITVRDAEAEEIVAYIEGAGVDSAVTTNTTPERQVIEELLDTLRNLETRLGIDIQRKAELPRGFAAIITFELDLPADTVTVQWPISGFDDQVVEIQADTVYGPFGVRCVALSQNDMETIESSTLAATSDSLIWNNRDRMFRARIRPLLPDENACSDLDTMSN